MADINDNNEAIRNLNDTVLEAERQLAGLSLSLERAKEKAAKAGDELDGTAKSAAKKRQADLNVEAAQRKLEKAQKELAKTTLNYSKELLGALQGAKSFAEVTMSTTGKMGKGATDIDVFNDMISMSSNLLGGLLEKIPVVGGALGGLAEGAGTAATYLVDQLQSTYTSFNELSSIGATAGDGMQNIVRQFDHLQLPLGSFTKLIADNSTALAAMGATTQDSINAITTVAGDMKRQGLDTQFRMLGYSSEDIVDAMTEYADLQRRMGVTDVLNQKNLAQSTGTYLEELDAMAKLTGKNRQEIQEEMKARMGDARFRAMTDKMVAEGNGELATKITATITGLAEHDEQMATGLSHLMTGYASSDEAIATLRSLGSEAQGAAMALKEGQMSQEEFLTVIQQQSGRFTKNFNGIVQAMGNPDGYLDYTKQMDFRTANEGKMGEALDKSKTIQEEQMATTKGLTGSLNDTKIQIEETATTLAKLTSNSEMMANVVNLMSDAMHDFVDFLDDNFGNSRENKKNRLRGEVENKNAQLDIDIDAMTQAIANAKDPEEKALMKKQLAELTATKEANQYALSLNNLKGRQKSRAKINQEKLKNMDKDVAERLLISTGTESKIGKNILEQHTELKKRYIEEEETTTKSTKRSRGRYKKHEPDIEKPAEPTVPESKEPVTAPVEPLSRSRRKRGISKDESSIAGPKDKQTSMTRVDPGKLQVEIENPNAKDKDIEFKKLLKEFADLKNVNENTADILKTEFRKVISEISNSNRQLTKINNNTV